MEFKSAAESLELDDLDEMLLGDGSETVLLSNGGRGGREAGIAFEAGVVAAEVVAAPAILTLSGGDCGVWFAPDPDKDPNEGTTNWSQGSEWLRRKPGEGLVTPKLRN